MDLTTYKEQLRSEILAIGKSNGVRKTCREANIGSSTWTKIRRGKIANAETLEKILTKIKTCCNVA